MDKEKMVGELKAALNMLEGVSVSGYNNHKLLTVAIDYVLQVVKTIEEDEG